MALVKAINPSKRSLSQGIKYITNPEKTKEDLISGKDCDAQTALEEMKATKEMYGKTEGRQYKHFVQSFSRDDPLDPSKAHQIGYEMAQKAFPGYEVLVATHTDTDHLHNHILVNSVSFETGEKYRQSIHDLSKIKELSNQICEREGLRVMTKEEQTPGKYLSMNEYQVATKGESWKFKTMADIDQALDRTRSKEEFIRAMEDKGYKVTWNHRKYITYTTPEGNKVRDNKLHDPKYLKEAMENGFERIKENQLQPGQSGRSPDEKRSSGDIGTDILFDKRNERQNQVHSERADQSHRINSAQDGTRREDQTGFRGETPEERDGQKRTVGESQHNSEGLTRRNKGSQSNEFQKAGGDLRNSQRGSEKESGKQHQNDSRGRGSSAPDKNYPESKLEGKGEAIRNTTPDNNRTSDRNSRSVPTGDPLDDTIKALGNSFEKVQKKETFEAERMKQKLEQKMQNPRSKQSQEDELER